MALVAPRCAGADWTLHHPEALAVGRATGNNPHTEDVDWSAATMSKTAGLSASASTADGSAELEIKLLVAEPSEDIQYALRMMAARVRASADELRPEAVRALGMQDGRELPLKQYAPLACRMMFAFANAVDEMASTEQS